MIQQMGLMVPIRPDFFNPTGIQVHTITLRYTLTAGTTRHLPMARCHVIECSHPSQGSKRTVMVDSISLPRLQTSVLPQELVQWASTNSLLGFVLTHQFSIP